MLKKKKKKSDEHKFCPVCGKTLELNDAYCTECGYSFVERQKKKKGKKVKWLNVLIVLIILLSGYFLIRYTGGQSIFPTSWQDAISPFRP